MDGSFNDFSFKMLHSLLVKSESVNDENIIYSPLTLISTLLLLIYGSRGSSSVQLARILFLSNVNSPKHTLNTTTSSILHIRTLMNKLTSENKSNNGTTTNRTTTVRQLTTPATVTHIKSELFVPHSLTILKDFKLVSRELFDFDTSFVNIESGNRNLVNVATKKLFNSTVKEPFHSLDSTKLHYLLQQIELRQRQLLMLSLMHLKMHFKNRFIPIGRRNFYLDKINNTSGNKSLAVPFVSLENYVDIGHCESLDSTVLTLPLTRHKLHFIVILPDEGISVDQVATKLHKQPSDLNDHLRSNNVSHKAIHLLMPFINIAWNGTIKNSLKFIGIRGVFEESQANLVNIAPNPLAVTVGDIVQANRISMSNSLNTTDDPPQVWSTLSLEQFTINRPFIFLVSRINKKKITDSILLGKITNPLLT